MCLLDCLVNLLEFIFHMFFFILIICLALVVAGIYIAPFIGAFWLLGMSNIFAKIGGILIMVVYIGIAIIAGASQERKNRPLIFY